MEHAQSEAVAGDLGYPIGRRVLELLTGDLEEDCSADPWNLMRRVVAEVFENNVFRMATTPPKDIMSVALCARGILDLALPQHLEAHDTLQALRYLAELDSPIGLKSFHREIDAIMMEFAPEEPEFVNAGSVTGTETSDDVGLRPDVVDSLSSIAEEVTRRERCVWRAVWQNWRLWSFRYGPFLFFHFDNFRVPASPGP